MREREEIIQKVERIGRLKEIRRQRVGKLKEVVRRGREG